MIGIAPLRVAPDFDARKLLDALEETLLALGRSGVTTVIFTSDWPIASASPAVISASS